MARTLDVYQLDIVGYDEALEFQRNLVDELHRIPRDEGALVLLEHPPVITIGRSGSVNNILVPRDDLERRGITVRETNRGGDVTYHGPGQLVGYPILPLACHGKDIHRYLRRLESVLIATLADYGVEAARRDGYTGVWTADGKIASIGIAVSHWITYHGFALNYAPDLDHFKLIHPCGLAGVRVTSIDRLIGRRPMRREVEEKVIEHFCGEFGFDHTRHRGDIIPCADAP